jgi:hypothetical protein
MQRGRAQPPPCFSIPLIPSSPLLPSSAIASLQMVLSPRSVTPHASHKALNASTVVMLAAARKLYSHTPLPEKMVKDPLRLSFIGGISLYSIDGGRHEG